MVAGAIIHDGMNILRKVLKTAAALASAGVFLLAAGLSVSGDCMKAPGRVLPEQFFLRLFLAGPADPSCESPHDEGLDFWTCAQCGEGENICWVDVCRVCAYPRSNPQAYLLRPVKSEYVTNRFSEGHEAIDLGSRPGDVVRAAEDGVVVQAGWKDRWEGNIVVLRHEDGLETGYMHLGTLLTEEGCPVKMGEVIALSGNTGASTGPHLHFEVCGQGRCLDPLNFLAPFQELEP